MKTVNLLLVAFLAFASSAAAEVTARIKIAPERAVLGVPVEITMVLANKTDQPYVWPTHVVARVIDTAGKAQFVFNGRGWSSRIDPFTVPASSTVTVILDAPTFLDGNNFVPNSIHLGPGRYRLELSFRDSEFVVPHATALDANVDPLDADHRVAAHFEILAPTGEDAVVYERLRGALKGAIALGAVGPWTEGDLHDWVWREHPSSSYAPFLRHPRLPAGASSIEFCDNVLKRLEAQPAIRDEVALELLERLSRQAARTYDERGLAAALKVADAVDRLVRTLESSPHVRTRQRLAERRADLVDRRRLLAPD